MEKILVIKKRAIGDTVIALGAIQALKYFFPLSKISVLANTPGAALLKNHPDIEKVIESNPKSNPAFGFQAIRKEKFDIIVNLHASQKTAFLSILSGSKVRVINNHSRSSRHPWSTHEVPDQGISKSAIDRDLDSVRALGFKIEPNTFVPKIYLTHKEREWANKFVHDNCVIGENCCVKVKKLIAISPNASKETKKWPLERFNELAKIFSKDHKILWFLDPYENIPEYFTENLIFVREKNIRNIAALLAKCMIYIGNDSGLKHIAAAVDTNTVTMFGPENPTEWHPYNLNEHPILFKDVNCRTLNGHWCSLETCSHHTCMKSISVNEVTNVIKNMLEN